MEKRLLPFCQRKQSFMVYRGRMADTSMGYGKYQRLVWEVPMFGTSDTNVWYNGYQPLVLSVSHGDIHCTQRRYRFMSI